MVKSAGFLKKLKKIGQLVGKGASWVNKNIVKPLNPVIDTALEFVPGGSAIKSVKDAASKGLDYLDENYFNTPSNQRMQRIVAQGADMMLDTQRSRQDRKYLPYVDFDDTEESSWNPPKRKEYSNPFGTRIN